MPQLIAALAAIVFVVIGVWVIGHEIEVDIKALGESVPKILNPALLVAAIAGIFLIVRRG